MKETLEQRYFCVTAIIIWQIECAKLCACEVHKNVPCKNYSSPYDPFHDNRPLKYFKVVLSAGSLFCGNMATRREHANQCRWIASEQTESKISSPAEDNNSKITSSQATKTNNMNSNQTMTSH